MANRKEDEKNERTIRNLLKLSENRRCINCNSLGPQYVCTNFSTFVCTPCSGIHREFTHRVKSVSMAKFTSQEVSALQGGGNASAREIYLKEWDSQRNSLPDGSNVQRLRDFIKHVYVERRFTGERNSEKSFRSTMGESDEFHGSRKTDSYSGSSRGPPYEGRADGHGGRSPGYNQEIQRNSDKRSPARSEVVNDWRREDRFGNERFSDGASKPGGGSPDSQRSDMSSPPIVRPIRDILGDNVSPIRVIEPPKVTGGRSSDIPPPAQRTTSSNSLASSSDTNPSEVKAEASFIDFDSAPEPPQAATVVLQEKNVTNASTVQPGVPSDDNWASFDSVKVNTPASNSLESSLLDLLAPGPVSAPSSSVATTPIQSSGPSFGNTANASTGGPWPNVMPQPVTVSNPGLASNMPQNPIHGPVGVSVGFGTEPPPDTKSGGRKELPADLFAMNYSYYPPNVQGWYPGSPYGAGPVGYPMHYMPMAVPNMRPVQPMPNMQPVQYMRPVQPVPNMQPVARSTNPFDFGDEPSLDQATTFPSLASMHGALPNVNPPSLGNNPSHAPLMPGQYPGQQFGGSIPQRPQGQSGFSHDQNVFTSLYPSQQPGALHTAQSATTGYTPTGGNPFG